MIKLIVEKPRVWQEGEELHIKVLRIHEYMQGRWELVIKVLEEGGLSRDYLDEIDRDAHYEALREADRDKRRV